MPHTRAAPATAGISGHQHPGRAIMAASIALNHHEYCGGTGAAFLEENAGKQFDPALVNIFAANREKFAQVMREFSDSEEPARLQPARHCG